MDKGPNLRKKLIKGIVENHGPLQLDHSFHETYKKMSPRNLVSLRRQFLCAAIKHEHSALLNYLLAKPEFRDLDSQMVSNIPRPLFVAIETGNALLVDAFLDVGSPVRMKDGGPESDVVEKTEMSAIEYACTFDHPEILKLLVSYDKESETVQRPTPLHYACLHGAYKCIDYLLTTEDGCNDINAFCYLHGVGWGTPLTAGLKHGLRMIQLLVDAGASAAGDGKHTSSVLHAVMMLSNEFYDKEKLSDLREIVQLLLDAGGCVEQEDPSSDSALYVLVAQIDEAKCADEDIATIYRSTVVEIARMLLAAGSSTDSKLVEHLLRQMKSYKPSRLLNPRYAHTRRNLHLLIAQLFEIVLKHQTNRLITYANECYYEILIVNVAGLTEKLMPILEDTGYLNNLYNTIIDCHSEVFRCLMLAGAGADVFKTVGTVVFSNNTIKSDVFLNAFVSIAGYSSQAGRTLSFIRKILNSLSTSQVDMLLRVLSTRLMFADLTPNVSSGVKPAFLKEAVEWLRGVQVPPSLMHLSRRAITRAFPNEVLCGVSTLGLPRDLEEYLLLRY